MCKASDGEVMERIRDGDEAALAELVRRYQDPLLNFFRRLGAYTDAEDLVQEVFVRVYRYRERYVRAAKFTTFLYTLARHTWADYWRKTRRWGRIKERAKEEMPRADARVWGRISLRLDTQQALDRLPEKLRVVLVMSLYQGLRYREIAEVLGIPQGTVKSRMFLALRRLREIYDDLF